VIDKAKLNVTVTLPLEQLNRILSDNNDEHGEMVIHESEVEYINSLVDDVCTGKVLVEEADDFFFFKSRVGMFILINLAAYKQFRDQT